MRYILIIVSFLFTPFFVSAQASSEWSIYPQTFSTTGSLAGQYGFEASNSYVSTFTSVGGFSNPISTTYTSGTSYTSVSRSVTTPLPNGVNTFFVGFFSTKPNESRDFVFGISSSSPARGGYAGSSETSGTICNLRVQTNVIGGVTGVDMNLGVHTATKQTLFIAGAPTSTLIYAQLVVDTQNYTCQLKYEFNGVSTSTAPYSYTSVSGYSVPMYNTRISFKGATSPAIMFLHSVNAYLVGSMPSTSNEDTLSIDNTYGQIYSPRNASSIPYQKSFTFRTNIVDSSVTSSSFIVNFLGQSGATSSITHTNSGVLSQEYTQTVTFPQRDDVISARIYVYPCATPGQCLPVYISKLYTYYVTANLVGDPTAPIDGGTFYSGSTVCGDEFSLTGGLCALARFLLIPSDSSISWLSESYNQRLSIPPFSWLSDIRDRISTLSVTSSTTSGFEIAVPSNMPFLGGTVLFDSSTISDFEPLSTLRYAFTISLYVSFLFYMYRRLQSRIIF